MKEFFSKLLNGMSIGIVVSLIPNALLGELLKLLIPHFPVLQHIFDITVYVDEFVTGYDWRDGGNHV